MSWSYDIRIGNLLRTTSECCRIFYIDSDDEFVFKHRLYEGRKLSSFWGYELELILINIEDFNELPYASRENIKEIRRIFGYNIQ